MNINIEIPNELHKRIKLEATLKSVTLKELVIASLEKKAKKDAEGYS
ncbi:hypothetical protein GOV07_01260 [Candidatus Woesearchaeota archaeon]|nr:hypothetical protein [Candidatus Woesearchaeota archaeon]